MDICCGSISSDTLQHGKVTVVDFASKVNASAGNESLTITGHTDSTGSEAYNQGLSERRADSVADYLGGKEGKPAEA